jgi:hypothetical protein
MVMLNLFTAVIIENFENFQDHEHWKLSPNALRKYVDAFHKFDDGSGTVRGADFERLLREIPPPLGLGGGAVRGNGPAVRGNDDASGRTIHRNGSGAFAVHFIQSLNVPLNAEGRVSFRRTAFELVRRVCECDMPPGDMRDGLEHAVRKAFPDLWKPIPNEMSWSALMCVVRVQRHWRARASARTAARAERARKKSRVSFFEKNANAEFQGPAAERNPSRFTKPLALMSRARSSTFTMFAPFAGEAPGSRARIFGNAKVAPEVQPEAHE